MRIKKYIVEKSNYPDQTGTHLLIMHSSTKYGENYQRIYKGSYKECLAKKAKLERLEKKNGKRNARNKITRISKREQNNYTTRRNTKTG